MILLIFICVSILFIPILILTIIPQENNSKEIDCIAMEVIRGEWGNGKERVKNMSAANIDYDRVQNRVNQILNAGSNSITSCSYNPKVRFYGLIISIILSLTLLITTINTETKQAVGNAKIACTINTNKNVYYDADSNKYFILHSNDWKPFNMYSKEYIDNDIAQKIIKVAEIVNEWED